VLVNLDPAEFEPLIRQTVEATIAKLDEIRGPFGDRLAFREEEAARLIGLEAHQLRDERGRGRIAASQVVNRGIRYTRHDLLNYLSRQRVGAEGGAR
jgi:hypothetical protein